MDTAAGIIVYLLLWWWVFFMILPIGVKREEFLVVGQDPGAPVKTYLWKKVAATSVIAIFLWLGVNWIISAEFFSFREMAKGL